MAEWNQPLQVKQVTFENRIVMAPMLPFGWPEKDGGMSEKTLAHYLKRAGKGMGLLICQALLVSPENDLLDRAGAYKREHLCFIKKIADACHAGGTRVFAQLAYAGFDASGGGGRKVTELSTEKMAEIGRDFVHSVRLLKEAGCDGAELHCAHGSFLNAVHSPIENTRQDRYGGDLEGRLTLLKEIIEGCRECIDDSFILSCRMGWTETLEGDIALAQAMEKLGVEMLHVSGGIPADRSLDIPEDFPYNAFVYTGTRVKQHVNIPVTVVNDLQTLRRGNELLREDACDLIAYGRPFLADPDFALHAAEDPDYIGCRKCKACQFRTDGDRCPGPPARK